MEENKGVRRGAMAVFREVPSRVKWIIYLTSFSSIGYGYLIVVVSAYLPETGLDPGWVGILIGVNGAAFVISAVPLGILADRKGRKGLFVFGLSGVPPSLAVFGLTTDLPYLLAASVVAGVCEGALLSTWNALIADQTDLKNREAAFSLSFIYGNAAFGLGMALPILFPTLEGWTGWDSHSVHSGAFLVLALVAALSPMTLWFVLRSYKETLHPRKRLVWGKSGRILLRFSGANSMIGLGAGFIIPLIPTWLFLKFSVPDSLSGPLLAVSNVTMGLAAVISSRLASQYGQVRAIVLTQGLSTVFMLSLAFISDAALAAGIYLIRAALMNMSTPILDAYLMGIVSKEERGFASAINSLIWRMPNSASTVVGGYLLAQGSYDLPFFLATAFYVSAITLFFHMFKDIKPVG